MLAFIGAVLEKWTPFLTAVLVTAELQNAESNRAMIVPVQPAPQPDRAQDRGGDGGADDRGEHVQALEQQ
jgi:hypothetical protein